MRQILALAALLTALTAPALADQLSAIDALALEDKVVGASWRGSTLVIFFEDDGAADRFADAVCGLLARHDAAKINGQRTLVRVMDAAVPKLESELASALCFG